jgi:glycosyltransferase involved in cell wall biosynthesis
MSTAGPLDVSVVVALRNSATTVPLLLDALDRQTLDPERWELVMVDDASTDETPALIARHGRARLVRSETHVGLPAGRNLGIRAAKAAVVALTDGDTVPDPTWLERGLGRFADPGVDILAGGITIPAGASPTVASLLDAAAFLDQERYVLRGFGAGANLWMRREVFGRAGPFEERLAAYGGDEEEFCARARAHGASVV